MKEKTVEVLFWLVLIVIYSVIGWILYIYVLKPVVKKALQYFVPPTIEQHIDNNKNK